MNKILTLLATVAMIFALSGCRNTPIQQHEETAQATELNATARIIPAQHDGTVHQLTDPELYAPDGRVEGLTILDFTAVWCGPCRQLSPVFREMAAKYKGKATFVSVDVDRYGSVMDAYRLGNSIPVVLILHPDGRREHFTGTRDLLPAAKFEAIIDRNLQ